MSFRLKIVLGVAAIEITLLAILIFSGIHYIRSSNEDRLLSQAKVSARMIATMTTDAVVALDLATLDELTSQAVRNPSIEYARILDASGRVLARAGDTEALARYFVEDKSVDDARKDLSLDISAPILIDGHLFGHVQIGAPISALEVTVAEARDWMLGIAATEIILVAIFGLLLGQILTAQLDRLQVSAKRVAEGEFGYQMDVKGRDELAETATSFNRMSDALRRYKKATEDALAEAESGRARAESRLLEAIDAMPHGVAIVEDSGEIMHVNGRYELIYGLSLGESAHDMPFSNLASLQATSIKALPYSLEEPAKEATIAHNSVERIRRLEHAPSFPRWETAMKDGRILLCTQRRMPSGGTVLVDTDVTDLHRAVDRARDLERELSRKQKLESLGTLAGGVAHEINTPSQFIGDNLSFMRDSMNDVFGTLDVLGSRLKSSGDGAVVDQAFEDADIEFLRDEIPQALEQSLSGVKRIREIVNAVKVYSHPGSTEFAPTDVNSLIRAAMIVTKSRWKDIAEIDAQLYPDLPIISANEGQLNQVFVNLIINAADAIEEAKTGDQSGQISIRTQPLDDGRIEIEIADSGKGIPDEVVEKIFDPFFTTKAVGKGSGQGLTISRSLICDSHGGTLEVEKSDIGGALFRVILGRKPNSKDVKSGVAA